MHMHCEMIATVTTSNIEASCVPGPGDTAKSRPGLFVQRELTHLCGREINVHKHKMDETKQWFSSNWTAGNRGQ